VQLSHPPKPANAAKPQVPFPFTRMGQRWDALDRIDLRFRWGRYGIKVLRCHLTFFPAGFVVQMHHHSEFEFHFIPQGRGKLIAAEREFELSEGMFYLTGPGVPHEQRSDLNDPMYELCLHCDIVPLAEARGDGWGRELEDQEAEEAVRRLQTMPAVPFPDRFNAMSCFVDAYRIWEEGAPGFYTSLKQAVIQMLLRSARVVSQQEEAPALPERDMAEYRFRMAVQFIEDNHSRPITLEQVAERVGISPRQLQRLFRSQSQSTFRDWVEDVRLRRACAALRGGTRPIGDIALENGYANPNYLYPVFKKKFGMTPAAYRRLHLEGGGASLQPREETHP
jgi:AraC-like DNA-binding protein/mannose-6-phosphate isomerase-like protein (cupin superfamily)